MTDSYSLSTDAWDLHRRAERDRARHNEKVREIIRKNIGDVVAEGGSKITVTPDLAQITLTVEKTDSSEKNAIKSMCWREIPSECFTAEIHLSDFFPEKNWQQAVKKSGSVLI